MIFNILYWGFGFLRMGTSGFTAQAYGRQDEKESILILSRSILVGLSGAVLLLLLQKPVELLSFVMVRGSAGVESLAAEYFRIRIWAAPATLTLYSLTGWYLGMQNAKIPMIIAIVVNLLNILFNLFFVLVLGMKSDGVALGTVLAQYGGLITGAVFFTAKYRKMAAYWIYREMMEWKALKRFFSVNRDIFIRTLCLIFVFSFFTSRSARQDDTILAVNTLLLQYFMIFSYLIDGFAYAAEALVGKYTGEGNRSRLTTTIRYLFYWGLGISIPFTLTYLFGGEKILWLLTNNAAVIDQAKPYLFWIALIPLISFSAFLWDGIFIGATASKGMRNSMLISTLLVFIPVYFVSAPFLSNHGLWLALILFMISRGATQTLIARRWQQGLR
jgi:MATE family multidrug resistance protein